MIEKCNELDPKVWGPHYWFVLHKIALTYPDIPNETTKKKYYDFVQNLPLFVPDVEIAKTLVTLIDNYPVTPYLESKESFMKWVHFLHNHINKLTNKPPISYENFLISYFENYKPKDYTFKKKHETIKNILFIIFIFILLCLIIFLYKK